jgi:hypothetical protein
MAVQTPLLLLFHLFVTLTLHLAGTLSGYLQVSRTPAANAKQRLSSTGMAIV